MYLSQGTGAFFLLVQRKEGPCYLQPQTATCSYLQPCQGGRQGTAPSGHSKPGRCGTRRGHGLPMPRELPGARAPQSLPGRVRRGLQLCPEPPRVSPLILCHPLPARREPRCRPPVSRNNNLTDAIPSPELERL